MRLPAIALLCILAAACLAQQPTADLTGSFPLGVYWPWERVGPGAEFCGLDKWDYVERCLDDMQAHNVDSLWVVNLGIAELPDLAQRVAAREMTLVPALGELHYQVDWRRNNWEYLERESRRAIEAAGSSPAVLAWALCDEPRSTIVEEMETFRGKFHEWGATQPAVVVTMWHDTVAYADQSGFPVVCPDIYPFFSAGNPNGPNTPAASRAWYRRHCMVATEAAARNGKTPWVMPQAYHEVWGPWSYDEQQDAVILPGGLLHWRPPTEAEMRWQVWAAVAAGMKGFFWFCYGAPPADSPEAKPYEGTTFPPSMAVTEPTELGFPGALIRRDLETTPQYEVVGEVFGALKALLPLLADAVPAKQPLLEVEPPGWTGAFRSPAAGRDFAVVVNDDTERAQEVRCWAVRPTDFRDLRTGNVIRRGEDGTLVVPLGPGDGTVLEPVAQDAG